MSQTDLLNDNDSSEELINVDVTFRHTESTAALKSYATDKVINCLLKFVNSPTSVHIILSIEKRDHLAEVTVRSKRFDLVAKATTEDLYSAIDRVVDNLTTQIRKQKDKQTNHKS